MRRIIVGSVCAAILLAGGAALARESASVPRFEGASCPDLQVPELAKASCGYLVVPENRDQPTGRTIRLIVAILPAESPRPWTDPVVYLSGGPGGIALFEIPFLIRSGLNWDHDLVVMNQRGTYLSQPALTCESADAFARRLIGLRFYSRSTKRAHLAATRGCRREVLAKGVDLSAYNSRESAADFADLRRVLGYDRWNVFGVSYGTYLAQTLMRDHPEGIRSVILDSTVPVRIVTLPQFWHTAREGFDNLFRACEAETACREIAPHLKTTFTRLVREFEARPRRVVVANPQGKATKVVLDGGALIDWLRKKTYDTPQLRQVPDQTAEMAAGRLESVARDRATETVVASPSLATDWPSAPSVASGTRSGRTSLPGSAPSPPTRRRLRTSWWGDGRTPVKTALGSGGFHPARPQFAAHRAPTSRPFWFPARSTA